MGEGTAHRAGHAGGGAWDDGGADCPALLGGGGAVMDELQQNGTGSVPLPVPLWLAAVLLLAVLALYAVSWRVSVAWYGKYKK